MKEITCEQCPYFSGERIHGHGEYFGECNLIFNGLKILESITKKKVLIKNHYTTDFIVWKDTKCKIFEIKE